MAGGVIFKQPNIGNSRYNLRAVAYVVEKLTQSRIFRIVWETAP